MLLFNNIDIDNTNEIVSEAQTDEQVIVPNGETVKLPAGINIINDHESDIQVTFTYKKQGGFSLSSPLFTNKAVSPGHEYTISQLAKDEASMDKGCIAELSAGETVKLPAGINIINDHERDIQVTFTYKKQGGFSLSSPLFSNKTVSPGHEYTISQLAEDEVSINPCFIELSPGTNILLQGNTHITNDTDSHLTIVYNGWGQEDLRVFDNCEDRTLLSVSIIELGGSYLLSELIEKDRPICGRPGSLEKPLPKD